MASRVFPHSPFRELAPDVWWLRGSNSMPALHRNMIVVRRSGALIIHSVVALDEHGLAALQLLGSPAVAIVPNIGHQMDGPFYQERFPDLRFVCPAAIRGTVEKKLRVAGTVEDVLPDLGWILHRVPGSKMDEYVYEVPISGGGRMLIANDVFGSAHAAQDSLIGRLSVRPFLGLDRLGIPRIFRWRWITDLAAVKRFAGELAEIPDLRLITVSHGDPVTDAPAASLRRIAA